MKALSVIQPWASLILLGAKRYETRSWQTLHRGPLVIHASARIPLTSQALCYTEPFKTALAPLLLPYHPQTPPGGNVWDLPKGALLGIVEVIHCWPAEEIAGDLLTSQDERDFGDYRPGRWAWELRVIERFVKPVAIAGHLGLWDVPAELLGHSAYGIHAATGRTH